jgi:dihydrofolate reductase
MLLEKRKVFLYIAMSLDGYIASPDESLNFLSIVEKPGEDYGYNDFIESVDAVILGRKTYDKVMSMGVKFPHIYKDTYIITRSTRPDIGNIKFYSGGIKDLVVSLKRESGKHIFIDGGAEIVNELLKDNLIDEFIISVIPILLGDGIALFKDGRPEQRLKFVSSKAFDTGLVQLHYRASNEFN